MATVLVLDHGIDVRQSPIDCFTTAVSSVGTEIETTFVAGGSVVFSVMRCVPDRTCALKTGEGPSEEFPSRTSSHAGVQITVKKPLPPATGGAGGGCGSAVCGGGGGGVTRFPRPFGGGRPPPRPCGAGVCGTTPVTESGRSFGFTVVLVEVDARDRRVRGGNRRGCRSDAVCRAGGSCLRMTPRLVNHHDSADGDRERKKPRCRRKLVRRLRRNHVRLRGRRRRHLRRGRIARLPRKMLRRKSQITVGHCARVDCVHRRRRRIDLDGGRTIAVVGRTQRAFFMQFTTNHRRRRTTSERRRWADIRRRSRNRILRRWHALGSRRPSIIVIGARLRASRRHRHRCIGRRRIFVKSGTAP